MVAVVAAASAKSVGSALNRQVTEAAGSYAWALHLQAGMARGGVRSAAPAVWEAAAGAPLDRAVE
jgi:hypothetical protein